MMKFFTVIVDCQFFWKSSFGVIIQSIGKKACFGHLEEEYGMMPSDKRNKVPGLKNNETNCKKRDKLYIISERT